MQDVIKVKHGFTKVYMCTKNGVDYQIHATDAKQLVRKCTELMKTCKSFLINNVNGPGVTGGIIFFM